MITLEQAKTLRHGQVIYHTMLRNADKTPRRYRVNGAVKTWKRSPDRVRVPLKYGLYAFDALDETNLYQFALTEADAKQDVTLDMDDLMGKGFTSAVTTMLDEDQAKDAFQNFNEAQMIDLLARFTGGQ